MQVYPNEKNVHDHPWFITPQCDYSKCGWPDEGAGACTGGLHEATLPRHTKSNRVRVGAGRKLLSRLRVEKIEGGLMVAGVLVAANCRVALPVFGFLFLLAGAVLTAAAYRGPESDEEPNTYFERVELTGNSRILGPACLVVGAVMLLAGILLCSLTRRARKQERQRRVGFHCPVHGDFYPTSLKDAELADDEKGLSSCWKGNREEDEEELGPRGRANSVPSGFQQAPMCPHSSHTSARSSLCSPWNQQQQQQLQINREFNASPAAVSRCPTPQPFLVPSGSISSGMVPSQRLSPDQTFGSIRSLSASREVASFPMSRTPSPPPQRARERCVIADIPAPTTVPTIPPPRPPPPNNTVRIVAPADQQTVIAG